MLVFHGGCSYQRVWPIPASAIAGPTSSAQRSGFSTTGRAAMHATSRVMPAESDLDEIDDSGRMEHLALKGLGVPLGTADVLQIAREEF